MQHNSDLIDDETANQEDSQSQMESEQYLTFYLAGEEYGIEIIRVQAIQSSANLSNIPNTPNYILGVINLRGHIVPILDLRVRFSLEQAPFDKNSVVIIVKLISNNEAELLGLVVDAVSETYRFESNQVQPSPQISHNCKDNYLKGIALVEEKLIILLDIDKILELEKIKEITN